LRYRGNIIPGFLPVLTPDLARSDDITRARDV
jgi:hypothetical protein